MWLKARFQQKPGRQIKSQKKPAEKNIKPHQGVSLKVNVAEGHIQQQNQAGKAKARRGLTNNTQSPNKECDQKSKSAKTFRKQHKAPTRSVIKNECG